MDAIKDETHVLTSPTQQSTIKSAHLNRLEYDCLGTPKGLKHASVQVKSSQRGSKRVKSYCVAMVSSLMLYRGQSYDNRYLLNLPLTPDFGLYNNLGAYKLGNHPHAMKESMIHDLDTPSLHEAMSGENRYDLLTAIRKEISELEQRNNWKVARKASLTRGAKLLP